MSSVRIEAACCDVLISFVLLWKRELHSGKNKNPPENPAGFRKTVLQSTRSEIPPAQNDVPCDALQHGGGNHRLCRFNEHFDGMLL
jgi:hypothetical protein